MCSTGDGFKLCTCSDDIDKEKPHWVLERFKINQEDINIIIVGSFESYYLESIKYILEQLNNHNPFDFDYKPKNKDLLTLNFEKGSFHLIYDNNRWGDFEEYEDIENQIEEIQKGLLKGGLKISDIYRRRWD